MRQTSTQISVHQEIDTRAAVSMAHDRDVGGIAAELGDVLLDPVQGGDLIHQNVVRAPVVRIHARQKACFPQK